MSTSLLYHAFNAPGYHYRSLHVEQGRITLHIEKPRERLRCPDCGNEHVWVQGSVERTLRTVPIGTKPVFLHLQVPRVWCGACQRTRQIKLGFADPKKQYTRAFERYVLDLSQRMTIQDVARHLGVGWDTVKDIQARSLEKRFGKPKVSKLKQIAIDEIAVGKGHRYLTVVLNLLTGAVVFVGDGKGAEALTPFFRSLGRFRRRIKAVAIDMSKAYIRAVRDHLPNAVLVFDHFHVVKLFNEKLSAFRRLLYHQASSDRERQVLKGTRWLLLKNPENLEADRDEQQRLEEALRLNEPLATAYYLKEDLRQIWMQSNKRTARRVLVDWVKRARASEIRMLIQFAATLEEHREGILAYYDYRISTGPLEGVNNKIRTMQRQAYGYRDQKFFKLKLLGLHQTKRALVG